MSSEKELEELCRPEFWDNRYAGQLTDDNGAELTGTDMPSYEWFRDYHKLRAFFQKWLPSPGGEEVVLHLGCGNSTLTSDLYSEGYKHQINVDFSEVVINAMMTKYASLGQIWSVMDVRQLEFQDASIDAAIDKSTLDAFLHGSLWNPPEDVREYVGAYVDQVARVLKPGGKWLYITYRQPHFMKQFLLREDKWSLEVETLVDPDGGGGFEYFGFVMTRHDNPP
ncbi:S-adenosyl-L-methionine-dependent methyltransferase [Rhexocercosporidium sp. MPI-PUGE-AT-0058]|nr:S-adenosyl-L-methionine-dependent methyltransferase [Rhexocercosporidium sp. MPI-PUGE-AT-0058]